MRTHRSGIRKIGVASWGGSTGNDAATWNPTLSFRLLPSQIAGTYHGTVTISVA